MDKEFSLNIQTKQQPSQKQLQRMMMSADMQKALLILQTPVQELSSIIETEITLNPILEQSEEEEIPEEEFPDEEKLEILKLIQEEAEGEPYDPDLDIVHRRSRDEEKLKTFLESSLPSTPSLYEHLIEQAKEVFDNPFEYTLAELLIGSLNERGFLSTPIGEIAILSHCTPQKLLQILQRIQAFDPIGIAAKDLQECLLIQLKHLKMQNTVAFMLIDKYYEDFIKKNWKEIVKKAGFSILEIEKAVELLAKLEFYPGTKFAKDSPSAITPDINLKQEGNKLIVEVNDESSQNLHLNSYYLRLLKDESTSDETKRFIREKIVSAKWFLKTIRQRNLVIEEIGKFLIEKQNDFFLSPNGQLKPLIMREAAEALNVHESTIARTVANKYINTPKGIFPLKYFFSYGYSSSEGKSLSARTVKDFIERLIEKEDKHSPLSDQNIADLMKKKGIQCARRTIAKYRIQLKIGNTKERKKY